jgi:hypothetical protein
VPVATETFSCDYLGDRITVQAGEWCEERALTCGRSQTRAFGPQHSLKGATRCQL